MMAKPSAKDVKVVKHRKPGGGRKTKLTASFLRIATKVISDGINAIIFTDEELLFQINEELPVKKRITSRTFERWKVANSADKSDRLDVNGRLFCRLIKKALQIQKKHLFDRMHDSNDSVGWQRFAWIIERKFKDWNIHAQVQKVAITDTKGNDMFKSMSDLSDEELETRRQSILQRIAG